MTGRIHVLERFIVAVAILAGSPLLGQSTTQTAAPPPPGADARTRTTLLPQTAVSANTHIELDLRSGDYEVRPSHTGDLGVIELRDPQSGTRATTLQFSQQERRASLKIDPPSGNHSPHIILELPRCSDLSIHLPAGELVFTAPPCTHTDIRLQAGELVAKLGAASEFASIRASVSIGEVDARQLGQSHGGFFNSIHADGAGQRTFVAHVTTGQITIDTEGPSQPQ